MSHTPTHTTGGFNTVRSGSGPTTIPTGTPAAPSQSNWQQIQSFAQGLDWGGLVESGLGGYLSNENIHRQEQAGVDVMDKAHELGTEAAGMTEFQPYTVTGPQSRASVDEYGSARLGSTEALDRLGGSLVPMAQGLFTRAGIDPAIGQADLYEQMRAIQRPEEQRDRLALEERMLSQGRLGLGSSAYGGSSPELLAQAQIQQDAMLKANLAARGQVFKERGQDLDVATGMLDSSFTPQDKALALLGGGTNVAALTDLGRRTGAGLFSDITQKGFDSYAPTVGAAATSRGSRDEDNLKTILDFLGV